MKRSNFAVKHGRSRTTFGSSAAMQRYWLAVPGSVRLIRGDDGKWRTL